MTRNELVARMDAGRAQLEAALDRIPQDRMLTTSPAGGWSVRDVLAHLEFWQRHVVENFRMLRRGESPEVLDARRIDELNAQVWASSQARSPAELRRGEAEAYRAVRALVEEATDAELFDPNHFAWADGRAFAAWIQGDTYEHYEEHLADLAHFQAPADAA